MKKPVLSTSASHTSSASNLTQTSISYIIDNKDLTNNQKNNKISNTYDVYSCVTPQKQNYSVYSTPTLTHSTPLNATLPIASFKLNTTTEVPPADKEYLCFRNNGKSSHASQCVRSRIMNKSIYYIIPINTFEQQCVVIKGMPLSV